MSQHIVSSGGGTTECSCGQSFATLQDATGHQIDGERQDRVLGDEVMAVLDRMIEAVKAGKKSLIMTHEEVRAVRNMDQYEADAYTIDRLPAEFHGSSLEVIFACEPRLNYIDISFSVDTKTGTTEVTS